MNIYSILGIIFGSIILIISIFYSFPQLYRLCKTCNTSGISLTTYIIYIITSIFWIIWVIGYYFEQINNYTYDECGNEILFKLSIILAIIFDTIDVLVMIFIINIKIKNILLCKKLKISELILAKQLLTKINSKLKQYWQFILAIILCVCLTVCICFTFLFVTHVQNNKFNYNWWLLPINLLASGTWEIFNWPQFIKTIKTKDTTGISLFWVIFMFVGCVVTFIYDLSLGLIGNHFGISIIPGLVCNGIIPSLGILIIKTSNLINAWKVNLSEVEYLNIKKSNCKYY